MPHPSVANVLSVLFMDVDSDAAIVGSPTRVSRNSLYLVRASGKKYLPGNSKVRCADRRNLWPGHDSTRSCAAMRGRIGKNRATGCVITRAAQTETMQRDDMLTPGHYH